MLFLIKFGTKLGIKLDIPKHFRENPLSCRDFSLKKNYYSLCPKKRIRYLCTRI